jgi:hypothetical protein
MLFVNVAKSYLLLVMPKKSPDLDKKSNLILSTLNTKQFIGITVYVDSVCTPINKKSKTLKNVPHLLLG